MHVILFSVGIHTNPYIAYLTIKPYSSNLLVLQCRLHTATEEGFEKHKFLKMQDCSEFLQIRSLNLTWIKTNVCTYIPTILLKSQNWLL